jgi:hypothetical protein
MALLRIPDFILALMFVVMSIALAVGGLALVRRSRLSEMLNDNTTAISGTSSMINFLYAVIVGSIVATSWSRFNEAQLRTNQEATYLGDLLRTAQGFEAPARHEFQTLLIRYAQDVLNNEWPAMAEGERIMLGSPAYEALWAHFLNYQPTTDRSKTFYGIALGQLNSLAEQRRLRILTTQMVTSPPLWVLFVVGGAIAIFFTYLFPAKNWRFKALKVALLAAMFGFVFYLLLILQYPYAGDLRVQPVEFMDLIELWTPRLRQS